MNNGGKNKSVAFITFFGVVRNLYECVCSAEHEMGNRAVFFSLLWKSMVNPKTFFRISSFLCRTNKHFIFLCELSL